MSRQAPPTGESGNATAPGYGPGAWPDDGTAGQHSDSAYQPSAKQPIKEDVIADLFSRLQGLLSGNL